MHEIETPTSRQYRKVDTRRKQQTFNVLYEQFKCPSAHVDKRQSLLTCRQVDPFAVTL